MTSAFGAYFCMYAFRKPFTVATYRDVAPIEAFDYKSVLVVVQVLGYMASKFAGIRYVAEIEPRRRVRSLLVQIGLAELVLVLFAATPPPYNAAWLFVNGFMLGMIFGLVLGFLEGRRHTEAMIAALCASFILADGVMKSVGSWLLSQGVPEFWMPAAAGLLFVPPLLICCAVLRRVPPPDAGDVSTRGARTPMSTADRRRFFRRYGVGLVPILLMFLFVTVLRSIRADFAPEIWAGLGVTPDAGLFSRTELLVAPGILLLYGSIVFIRNNRIAFLAALGLSVLGLPRDGGGGAGAGVRMGVALHLHGPVGSWPLLAVHCRSHHRFRAPHRHDAGPRNDRLSHVPRGRIRLSGICGRPARTKSIAADGRDHAVLPRAVYACRRGWKSPDDTGVLLLRTATN